MVKKAPEPTEKPASAQEQIRAYVDSVFEYATEAAQNYRDQLIMNALKSLEIGMNATQANMLAKQHGHHIAVQQSITNAGAALTQPLQEMRQRMESEKLDSPEILAQRFAPNIEALSQPKAKPVTMKEPEGEVVDLDKIGKIVGPEKPKATK